MSELVGQSLGHYRIVDKIGAGGMGEVYRARDERLDRDVAIKVLPEAVANDPERLARFEREAKLLASLSHQNIATLYGIEECGGARFLVMELAEGETLADRIARGPLPVDDALAVARQIAHGLESAHERGIIHRDLKPANVMVSPERKVKILDFGLAKAWVDELSDVDLAESPTITAEMTAAGVLLGTAAYMSPEQATGKRVDKRTDIWAYGCVLYELLTGRRTFAGDSLSETTAAILKEEPDWGALPSETPANVQRLLRRCLRKDPDHRLHDIADARISILETGDATVDAADAGIPTSPRQRVDSWKRLAAFTSLLALALGAFSIWSLFRDTSEPPNPVARVVLPIPDGEEVGWTIGIDISPDGSRVAYTGPSDSGKGQLWLRSLDQDHGTPIPGTDGGTAPSFSPDGLRLAFVAGQTKSLRIVSTTGSPPVTLVEQTHERRGGDWGPDGMLYFANVDGGISRIPPGGGEAEVVTTPDPDRGELDHRSVDVLPNGRGALLSIRVGDGWDDTEIGVADFKTGAVRKLGRGANPVYARSGHVLYVREDGVLLAAPFDQDTLELTGAPRALSESVSCAWGEADLSLSTTGTLLWVPPYTYRAQLVWVDRAGSVSMIDPDWVEAFFFPSLSPDGTRIAVSVEDAEGRSLWIKDLPDGAPRQLTFDEGVSQTATWTPDGQRLTYSHFGRGIKERWVDGHGEATLVLEQQGRVYWGPKWSHDMRWLIYTSAGDIFGYQPGGRSPPMLLLDDGSDEGGATLSPDGRWLAYVSNRSGRNEVYVRPFSDVTESRWKVSTAGGGRPAWAHNGHELFYVNESDQLVTVEYAAEPTFRVLRENPLFSAGQFQEWAGPVVAIDDQRFLMVRPLQDAERTVMLTFNLFTELERVAPTH